MNDEFFCALPWSLILIKRFLVSRFCFIIFESSIVGFHVYGLINLNGQSLESFTTSHHQTCQTYFYANDQPHRAFINKSNFAIWVSFYGAIVCNVNDKSVCRARLQVGWLTRAFAYDSADFNPDYSPHSLENHSKSNFRNEEANKERQTNDRMSEF